MPLRNAMRLSLLSLMSSAFLLCNPQTVFAADPLASNNGLYPDAKAWAGRFNLANLAYPTQQPAAKPLALVTAPLTTETAPKYANDMKAALEGSLRILIDDVERWDPKDHGWYDLVWMGEGSSGPDGIDPTSGREAIMNTYSGQLLPPETFTGVNRPTTYVQNHAVIYYNTPAATMLGELWENVYSPNLDVVDFPDGSIVAKVEAVTNTPETWPVIDGSSEWHVFRPTTEDQAKGVTPLVPKVLPVRPVQIALRVKDPIASPETGWVFIGFVYDKDAPGETAWERFVPVGVQWGDDPQFARDPNGLPAGEKLKESWINPNAPSVVHDTLGWGGRLSGVMDLATRHNVITASGKRYGKDEPFRASSCQSCHASSEFPFTANLYPSPNRTFPRDGEPFLMYDPGSEEWARWFQNLPGTQSISPNIGGRGLDYDMALMFAISSFNAAMGADAFVQERFNVH